MLFGQVAPLENAANPIMIMRRLLSLFVWGGVVISFAFWLWPLEIAVALLYLLRLLAILYILSIAIVLYYRFRNPAITRYMHKQRIRQAKLYNANIDGFSYQWVAYDAISDDMKLAAIAGEDIYFAVHYGFDWESIRQAQAYNKTKPEIKRGASTITQQMAKNLFLWPGPYLSRKILEAYLSLLVEGLWSKQRILEIYLNLAQFSPAIFGVEAAAQHTFGIPASQLDRKQAALLITVLPNPTLMSIQSPSHPMRMRQVMILESMRRLGTDYLAMI